MKRQVFYALGGRVGVVAAVCAGLLLTPGCSLFVKKLQPIQIRATDPQAMLIVDGREVGRGPTTMMMMLDRTKSHTVIAKTPTGRSGAANINRKISAYGVAYIVGGIFLIVPFLGLLGPGFWELEPDNVVVPIE